MVNNSSSASKTFISKAVFGSFYTYLNKAILMLSGIIIPILLVRNLSVEDYGSYKLIGSLLTLFIAFTSLGVQSVFARFLPEFITRKKYGQIKKVYFYGFLIRFISSCLLVMIFYFFKGSLFGFLNLTDIFYLMFVPIFMILVLKTVSNLIGPSFFNTLMDQKVVNQNIIVYEVLRIFLFSFVFYKELGLKFIVFSMLFVEIVSFLHYLVNMYKKFRSMREDDNSSEDRIALEDLKRMFAFGLYNFFTGNIAILHNVMIDNFVIANYMSVEMVGMYGFATTIVAFSVMLDPGKMLKSIFSTILVSKYTEDPSTEVVIKGYNFLNKISLIVFIPSAIGLMIICDKLILYLFGKTQYLSVYSVVVILLVFSLFSSLITPLGHIISLMEKNHIMLLCGFSSIYNLVMDIVLIRYYGIDGIAFATGSAMLLQYALYYIAIKKYIPQLRIPWIIIIKILTLNIPMILVCYFSRSFIQDIFTLLLVVFICGVVYLFSIIKFNIFDEHETQLITSRFRRSNEG